MIVQEIASPKAVSSDLTASHRKLRYAVCGLSIRNIRHFVLPLLGKALPDAGDFSANAEIVGILDLDAERVEAFNRKYELKIPFFSPEEGVEAMVAQTKADVLLVAGPDFTHCEHILSGLCQNLRVIVEKPMVINCEEMRAVLKAERDSQGSLVVTHNYRYSSINRRIKRLLLQGKIGKIVNIEMVYNLDTQHGSSFFYRWNRERAKSGGLSVHKAVHHLDLINWLTDSVPETVFAFGALNYYGTNGTHKPKSSSGKELTNEELRERCPYFLHHHATRGTSVSARLKPTWDSSELPYNVQYPQSNYIYDDAIDIEDTYAAVIRYRNGAFLSYSTNYSAAWEGFTLGINGTEGRLEVSHHSDPSVSLGCPGRLPLEDAVTIYPLFGGKEHYVFPKDDGSHGGGDARIRQDLFVAVGEESRELGLVSDSYAGALGIAAGEAIWRSSKEGVAYQIRDLLGEFYCA